MKPPAVVHYTEPLTRDETHFLKTRQHTGIRQLYKLARICMLLSFVIPFAGAWIRAARAGDPSEFSVLRYFLLVFWLLVVSSVICGIMYWRMIRPLRRDLQGGEKVVELATIDRKVFMPQDGSYHLYVNSLILLSMEVNAQAYLMLEAGDEVNILYAPYSKLHLGYF
jgi:hypothetical protein